MGERETGLRFLEDGGDPEFDWFRRPGIVRAPSGRMLGCYEGRRDGEKPHQALFARITDDAGASWSGRIPIERSGPGQMLHNIVPAFFGGQFHLFWNDSYRALYRASSADGFRWSEPEDLTEKLRAAHTDYPWNAFGVGSGHALTMRSGRVLIPTWFTTGGNTHKPSAFANIYSDDGFRTVGIGAMLLPDAR
ncbi:MAG: exo-alpha-sialidase, partial [Clostridiales bacterium]|nr:exo-alpha-sialidase [Clostridiales bacterium]